MLAKPAAEGGLPAASVCLLPAWKQQHLSHKDQLLSKRMRGGHAYQLSCWLLGPPLLSQQTVASPGLRELMAAAAAPEDEVSSCEAGPRAGEDMSAQHLHVNQLSAFSSYEVALCDFARHDLRSRTANLPQRVLGAARHRQSRLTRRPTSLQGRCPA